MTKSLKALVVALSGALTSVLTALLLYWVAERFDFQFFSVMHLLVIPTGAICSGIVAASGYYFAALAVHQRPTKGLLAQMLVIAAATMGLVYYLQYLAVNLEDGTPLSEVADFSDYLAAVLGHASYRFGRSSAAVEMGGFGYFMGALQFLGFSTGGLVTFIYLEGKPLCARCEKYFRQLAKVRKEFAGAEDFEPFQKRLHAARAFSPEYLDVLHEPHARTQRGVLAGAVNLSVRLLTCPECKAQRLREHADVFNGNRWDSVELRMVAAPEGTVLPEADFLRRAA